MFYKSLEGNVSVNFIVSPLPWNLVIKYLTVNMFVFRVKQRQTGSILYWGFIVPVWYDNFVGFNVIYTYRISC